jgi:hypothetical protein
MSAGETFSRRTDVIVGCCCGLWSSAPQAVSPTAQQIPAIAESRLPLIQIVFTS